MCELLGISSNKSVDLRFSFREWRYRGDHNPHGYGFAYWDSHEPIIIKAASNLYKATAEQTDEVISSRSHIFLCHVRLASVGKRDGVNTHPFTADLRQRRFVFAHNGTVRAIRGRRLSQLQADGATDLEHAFLWLLEQLADIPEPRFSERLKDL